MIAGQVKLYLPGLELCLLQAEYVGVQGVEAVHKALFDGGAQAVHVPGYQSHSSVGDLKPPALHGDEPVYLHALLAEFGLVVGHDGVPPVARDVLHLPAAQLILLEAPLKERDVVGLEPYLPAGRQGVVAQLLKAGRGQAALELLLFRPGVGEVYIYARNLARGEVFAEVGRVLGQETHVAQLPLAGALHGHDQRVGNLLHRDDEHIGIIRGHVAGEAAFAAAQLHVHLAHRRVGVQPASAQSLGRIFQYVGAALQPGDEVGFLSHSHDSHTP